MHRYIWIAFTLGVFTLASTSLAHAQTRTWVSGVGDDANPCSRTAPCKTFAGAISKTAPNGEISVLDPGGFGTVTITKSITINGEGTLAGIQGSLTNGINVNAPGIFVTLRYLAINGAGNGLIGINVANGSGVIIDHVLISGFATGIGAQAGNTVVTNSTIVRNTSFGAHATTSGSISFENTTFANNGIAVQTDTGTTIRLSNNSFYNNGTGFSCNGGTLASTGDNRKGNNVGGGGIVCTPNAVVTVQ
jgi:hypothetical protein